MLEFSAIETSDIIVSIWAVVSSPGKFNGGSRVDVGVAALELVDDDVFVLDDVLDVVLVVLLDDRIVDDVLVADVVVCSS